MLLKTNILAYLTEALVTVIKIFIQYGPASYIGPKYQLSSMSGICILRYFWKDPLAILKHFIFYVTYEWNQYARVLVLGRIFKLNLIFVCKEDTYPRVERLKVTHKH